MTPQHAQENFDDRALLFLHIPKAAGTTLHGILERQFSPDVVFTIQGDDSPKGIKEFINLSTQQREKLRLLKGHMPFGLHRYLSVPADYITMLRDPVDRVISHYYFVLKTPAHYLHSEVTSRQMSLTQFVESGLTTEVLNDQVRLISGVERVNTRLLDGDERHTLRANPETVTAEILEVAKQNLREHFIAVGLFSRFDQSLLLFKKRLGWKNIYYVRSNVTEGRPAKEQVPQEVRDLIAKHNELDVELYRYAQEAFDQAIKDQGAGFKDELDNFERNNKLNARISLSYRATRGKISRLKAALRKN